MRQSPRNCVDGSAATRDHRRYSPCRPARLARRGDPCPLQRFGQALATPQCISLRVAIGDDPAAINRDAGHADMGEVPDLHDVLALQDGDSEHLRTRVAGA